MNHPYFGDTSWVLRGHVMEWQEQSPCYLVESGGQHSFFV
jgi:hypothetical protein